MYTFVNTNLLGTGFIFLIRSHQNTPCMDTFRPLYITEHLAYFCMYFDTITEVGNFYMYRIKFPSETLER